MLPLFGVRGAGGAMNIDFVQALKDIQKEKDIPLDVLSEIVEAALVSAYRKHKGSTADLRVEIDWEASQSISTRKSAALPLCLR